MLDSVSTLLAVLEICRHIILYGCAYALFALSSGASYILQGTCLDIQLPSFIVIISN